MKKQAFSLAEVIIVMCVLAVLGTIAFISMGGYNATTRDSVRMTNLGNITKMLELKLADSGKVPAPSNSVDITSNGKIISHQGYASKDVLNIIGVHEGEQDPMDEVYYTYSTNAANTRFQVMGYLEEEFDLSTFNISKTYALEVEEDEIDYSIRFPFTRGFQLGMILDSTTQEPIQETGVGVDVSTTTEEYKLVLENGTGGTINGPSTELEKGLAHRITENLSCATILKNGNSKGSGLYVINPTGSSEFKAYCDMGNDGGGWTGLFSVKADGDTWANDSTQWTSPEFKGGHFLVNEKTSKAYRDLNTNSIKICRGDASHCFVMNHNLNIPMIKFYTDGISYTDFSVFNYRVDLGPAHSYNINAPSNFGEDRSDEFLDKLGITSTFSRTAYNKYGAGINLHSRTKMGLQADNNNRWPNVDNIGFGLGMDIARPNMGNCATITRPIATEEFLSTMLTGGTCYIDNPDTNMWFVYGK